MSYERIPYSSFMWKFGTTSFRTTEFNRRIEWQLGLLDKFWQMPKNHDLGWEKKYKAPYQKDIYDVKNRYYDWLVENGFTEGNDAIKYKAAREKTSGLYDMGLINENHRITEVGRSLMKISKDHDFLTKTSLGISKDSYLYLLQLLKLSYDDTGSIVRPLIVVLFLLSKLDYLSNDEFRYLMPLCTDASSTSYILQCIEGLRNGKGTIDSILVDFLLSKKNYQLGLERFSNNVFSEKLLLSVGMNRKSAAYDKNYINVYKELHAVYMNQDKTRIVPLFCAINKLTQKTKWKKLLFDTSITSVIKKSPEEHLLSLPESYTIDEKSFKKFFYITMHLYKAKATLEDYLDLNRRYLGLTNCFIFEDEQVKLDIVPKHFFASAIDKLYEQAYTPCNLLFVNCKMEDICSALTFKETSIISGISKELGTTISNIEEAYNEVDKLRYTRFRHLLEEKFDEQTLLKLLDDFENRSDEKDKEINSIVTDNADIPTIFEYVLAIIWYRASGCRGKILSFMKLSLDSNLLPVTHAAGGEADIVYEYPETHFYPKHSLLLEATLADSTNQRRMEMEPVSRHMGNHLLRTHNENSYCVFATNFLQINVISDFKSRKNMPYYDPQNQDNYVDGMKIIPIQTEDLKLILRFHITYAALYTHFQKAYESEERHAGVWYNKFVKIENSELCPAVRKLEHIEDDDDVFKTVQNIRNNQIHSSLEAIQIEIQKEYGERYGGMSNHNWYDILREYFKASSEKGAIEDIPKDSYDIAAEEKVHGNH